MRLPTPIAFLLLTLLAACGPIVIYPTTEGFHSGLPSPNSTVLVWSAQPAVTDSATSWLQRRGLKLLEPAAVQQMVLEDGVRLTHARGDEAQVLRGGTRLGADLVVFAESTIRTGEESSAHQEGGRSHGHGGQIYYASVSIRGVSLKTHEVVWSGTARMTHRFHGEVDESLAKLTCQALATAWAFRPAGYHRISSSEMCDSSG